MYEMLDKFNPIINYFQSLPIGTVTVERGFSNMNNIKTELRNKMKEDLLDGLLDIRINDPDWKDFTDEMIMRASLNMKTEEVQEICQITIFTYILNFGIAVILFRKNKFIFKCNKQLYNMKIRIH